MPIVGTVDNKKIQKFMSRSNDKRVPNDRSLVKAINFFHILSKLIMRIEMKLLSVNDEELS